MKNKLKEQRAHTRYESGLKIYFDIPYNFETKLQYQVKERAQGVPLSVKYAGTSKNVSTEGLCFVSNRKLNQGDMIDIELYLPEEKDPVYMEGEVRWSKTLDNNDNEITTGVKLITVRRQSVFDSICYNDKYKTEWSVVLDAVSKYINGLKGK